MPVDPENPRTLRKPPVTTTPARNDVVPVPAAAPRPGRQLNARQQARADAQAALTPQQVANRARRAAQAARNPLPANQPGGGLTQPPTAQPSTPSMGGPGNFVQPQAPASGGMGGPTPMPSQPSYGGGYPPSQGQYPPQQQQGYGDPYSVTDPFQQFMAAVPVMNMNRDKQISDSMAEAGFGGNRYGSFAAGKAAEIGGQTALQQDALLWKMLSDYGNQTQDRALQASGLGIQSAQAQDQMAMNRLQMPFLMGQYEQNRQDQFANTAYQDFDRNRLGWLGWMGQLAGGQGAGSPGQIYTTQTPGSPGAVDYLPLLMSLFGGG